MELTWPPYHCLLNPKGLVATHLLALKQLTDNMQTSGR